MNRRWYPAAFTTLTIACGGVTDTTSGGARNGGAAGTTVTAGARPDTGGNSSIHTGVPTGGHSSTVAGAGGVAMYGVLASGGINTGVPTGGTTSPLGWTGGAYGVLITGGRPASGGTISSGGSHASAGGIDAGVTTDLASGGGQVTCDYGCLTFGGGSSIDLSSGGTTGAGQG